MFILAKAKGNILDVGFNKKDAEKIHPIVIDMPGHGYRNGLRVRAYIADYGGITIALYDKDLATGDLVLGQKLSEIDNFDTSKLEKIIKKLEYPSFNEIRDMYKEDDIQMIDINGLSDEDLLNKYTVNDLKTALIKALMQNEYYAGIIQNMDINENELKSENDVRPDENPVLNRNGYTSWMQAASPSNIISGTYTVNSGIKRGTKTRTVTPGFKEQLNAESNNSINLDNTSNVEVVDFGEVLREIDIVEKIDGSKFKTMAGMQEELATELMKRSLKEANDLYTSNDLSNTI